MIVELVVDFCLANGGYVITLTMKAVHRNGPDGLGVEESSSSI